MRRVFPKALTSRNFVKAKAVIEDRDLFDAAFFRYTRREAELLDPQQRIFWRSPGKLSSMRATMSSATRG